jgi:predicted metal-dependent phosphoesterase TrpH
MRRGKQLLLCELHAHTTWSDGALTVRELVDVYGSHGFDVLCVTDHVFRRDDPSGANGVAATTFDAYLAEIDHEAERARARFDLLLLPGAELTVNDVDPYRSAHAVAVGLRRHVAVDGGLDHALMAARDAGAALIAAHPSGPSNGDHSLARRATRRFWHDLDALRPLVDRFELFNRHDVYAWIAEEKLPAVASGDFHVRGHLAGWKTLLACERDEESVVACLRSPAAEAHLVPFTPAPPAAVAAA